MYQELFCLGAPAGDSPHDFLLNFEVREIGARSSIIYLALKTGTPLSVSWRFRLWNDIEVDSENWVMELDASEDEEKALLMRSLFQIEPRKGHLEPGEIAFVKLSYCHRIEGSHKFPAILEITDGRTVHIYLNGRTVANPIRILTYRPDTHFLKSMVVGDADPPLQTTELINRGQFELQYNLDMTPLIAMQKSNYSFRVLWCLNPQGVIPPMESVLILWLFQPLEAKTYSVEIPVHLKDGEGGILILRGSGRLPTDAQDPNSTDGEPPRHPGTTYNWPGTPAVLTSELLDYGTVNELSVNHKLIGVQNLLTENPVCDFPPYTVDYIKSFCMHCSWKPKTSLQCMCNQCANMSWFTTVQSTQQTSLRSMVLRFLLGFYLCLCFSCLHSTSWAVGLAILRIAVTKGQDSFPN